MKTRTNSFALLSTLAMAGSVAVLGGCLQGPVEKSANSKQAATSCTSYLGAYGATPWMVPGQIEAEDYDLCGQEWAYYDTTPGNIGGAYRADDVDIEGTGDNGGGYDVGWIAAGEWLNYTADVTTSDSYRVELRVAATDVQTMHVEVDGTDVTGAISIPSTGGWQTWTTVTSAPFTMSAGTHILAAAFDTGSINLNWMSFQPANASNSGGNPPPANPGGGGSGFASIVSSGLFDQMFPYRNPFYTYDGLVAATASFPQFATQGTSDDQKRDVAAFLANVAHETGGLQYIDEIQTAPYTDSSVCAPAPGVEYYGRGPIQISWTSNYCKASLAIFGTEDTLRTNPDLVSTDAATSWATGLWYWTTTCESDIVSTQSFGATINDVNGPVECRGGNPTEVKDRVQFYEKFCDLLGVGYGSGPLSC
jgi:hypothetical protein